MNDDEPYIFDDTEPYDIPENAYRTDGPSCHWCQSRPAVWLWGPYRTHVCDYCQRMIAEGRQWDIIEELAASMTVRGSWKRGVGKMVDPERWRKREHAHMARWLELRTDCQPIPPDLDAQRERVRPAHAIPATPFDPYSIISDAPDEPLEIQAPEPRTFETTRTWPVDDDEEDDDEDG
jgi:hypothetical protein